MVPISVVILHVPYVFCSFAVARMIRLGNVTHALFIFYRSLFS